MNQKGFSKIVEIFLIILIVAVGLLTFKIYYSPHSQNEIAKNEDLLPKEKLPLPEKSDLPKIENIKRSISIPEPLIFPEIIERGARSLEEEKIIYFTNFYREEEGLEKLKENEILNKAAKERLEDMFSKQYFEHISPEGIGAEKVVSNLGYQYIMVGENLALGNFKTEKELVDGWMGSPGHRENILNPRFKEIGVAARKDWFKGKKTFIAVQIFATPLSECPLPDENLRLEIEGKKKSFDSLQSKAEDLKNEIENLQKQTEVLYQQAQGLISKGEDLINQGNDLVKEGNRIFEQEGDEEEAQKYWSQGQDLQKQGEEKINAALSLQEKINENNNLIETKINEYNNLVSQINSLSQELEKLISVYNSQVSRFNQCIQ